MPVNVPQAMQQAMAAYQAGRAQEAGEWCERVLAADPKNLDALNVLGALALQRGDAEGARATFERATRAAPDVPEVHNNLGVALQRLGRWPEALASFDRAIRQRSGFADAWFNRGVALGELERWEDALQAYRRVLDLRPQDPRALNNCGNVLQKLRRWSAALPYYQQALTQRPDYAEARNNRGAVLRELRRWGEALADYDAVLAANPANAEVLNNRSIALRESNRWEEAAAAARRAIEVRPGFAEAWNSLGFALHDLGRFDEAIAAYERAIELKPDFAEPHWNLALTHLLLGHHAKGWELFEWRWKTPDIAPLERRFAEPRWHGHDNLAGRAILVHSEQGLGDVIQFSRFVAPLALRGGRVIFEVPKPLVTLMRSSFPAIEVCASFSNTSPFDFHCPLASLPHELGNTLENLPGAPYLKVSDEARERWAARLGPRTRPRVGLAWAGNPAQRNDHNRSMPFARLAPLFGLDIEWHSLQKDVPARDRQEVERCASLKRWGDEIVDFSDTGALALALDLVVSVDTSASHLSGALGQRTWIPLTWRADYRYLLDREGSPWYPTARLFRQSTPGDWDGVVARLRAALEHDLIGN
ncbi:MAG TPA: tetratricopeptide repeat protein [Usitatibacter sp.]|nr:tetratricopeptide repeat protein [Usitatibacter sp.]